MWYLHFSNSGKSAQMCGEQAFFILLFGISLGITQKCFADERYGVFLWKNRKCIKKLEKMFQKGTSP